MKLRIAMDADCLIKLTKAGLKERVCSIWDITIPEVIRRETVEQAPDLPDAVRIRGNIAGGSLRVAPGTSPEAKGEDAVLSLYTAGGFDAVATDDARFIRHLRGLGVPHAVPGVVVVRLHQADGLTADEAEEALAALRPHISPDEHAAAKLMLSGGSET